VASHAAAVADASAARAAGNETFSGEGGDGSRPSPFGLGPAARSHGRCVRISRQVGTIFRLTNRE
jgi:hypothetical protein